MSESTQTPLDFSIPELQKLHEIAIGVACKYLGASLFVEDVAQEALLKLLLSSQSQPQVKNPRQWIKVVAKNIALDLIRKESKQFESSIKSLDTYPSNDTSSLEKFSVFLSELFRKLTKRQTDVLLKSMDGKTVRQIANEMKIGSGTVYLEIKAIKDLFFGADPSDSPKVKENKQPTSQKMNTNPS